MKLIFPHETWYMKPWYMKPWCMKHDKWILVSKWFPTTSTNFSKWIDGRAHFDYDRWSNADPICINKWRMCLFLSVFVLIYMQNLLTCSSMFIFILLLAAICYKSSDLFRSISEEKKLRKKKIRFKKRMNIERIYLPWIANALG